MASYTHIQKFLLFQKGLSFLCFSATTASEEINILEITKQMCHHQKY